MTCGSSEITFGELTPLKSPTRIPSCYGNVRLHQTTTRVCTRSPRRLRNLERKGRCALETPRTHDGLRDRSLPPLAGRIEEAEEKPSQRTPLARFSFCTYFSFVDFLFANVCLSIVFLVTPPWVVYFFACRAFRGLRFARQENDHYQPICSRRERINLLSR